ncbi:FIG006285: ICC-like protein phosphoesterase [hydrothermal vent metagenome]|uniref:FIG006285: ICC-like protein phosphoesterase n=1 Tax=hydrothermal vent metagenome TaxID=652676 RepID=A0A3B0TR96_9ZZZZ
MTITNTNRDHALLEKTCPIDFNGHQFVALHSGALFWPDENTLLVADLHLEKMSSFARNGQLLPPYDTGATLAMLRDDMEKSGAEQIICLGDSFHRDEGVSSLFGADLELLKELVSTAEWIWIKGNHDPSPHNIGGKCVDQIGIKNLALVHEPSVDEHNQIAGHLHPGARIRINGRTSRGPCFIYDKRLMILPAYGKSTGNLNILSDAYDGLFEKKALNVIMIGKEKLYPVATKFLI